MAVDRTFGVSPYGGEEVVFRCNDLVFRYIDGDVRKLSFDGCELLQRVYFAVRDEEWLNVAGVIDGFQCLESSSKTGYSYRRHFYNGRVDFEAFLSVVMDDNSIVFEATGRANSSFMKNRIGFCLHLPVAHRGAPCCVVHSDGAVSQGRLPEYISPHQPFKDIERFVWSYGGKEIVVSFEGDVFEMEDQRNWTDASFKVYSTPLDLPFPVLVKEGDLFKQRITVSVASKDVVLPVSNFVDVGRVSDNGFSWPSIGIMCGGDCSYLNGAVGCFPFTHLRVNVRCGESGWQNGVLRGFDLASRNGLGLYLVFYTDGGYRDDIEQFVSLWREYGCPVIRYVLFLSNCDFVLDEGIAASAASIFRNYVGGVPVGIGTEANFAQLNRNRPQRDEYDFIAYSIQPQEHASDLLSLAENIGGQSDTVATARSFSRGKGIHIVSLSLFRPFNANVDCITRSDVFPDYAYSGSAFEAGWFVGSLYRLIASGVEAITCVGNMEGVSPLVVVFRMIGCIPERILPYGSASPEVYSALAWVSKEGAFILLANLTSQSVFVDHPYIQVSLSAYEIKRFRIDLP